MEGQEEAPEVRLETQQAVWGKEVATEEEKPKRGPLQDVVQKEEPFGASEVAVEAEDALKEVKEREHAPGDGNPQQRATEVVEEKEHALEEDKYQQASHEMHPKEMPLATVQREERVPKDATQQEQDPGDESEKQRASEG